MPDFKASANVNLVLNTETQATSPQGPTSGTTDNTVSVQTQIKVDKIYIQPRKDISAGDRIQITAQIKNTGDEKSSKTITGTITFYANGMANSINLSQLVQLEPGEESFVDWRDVQIPYAGNYEITIGEASLQFSAKEPTPKLPKLDLKKISPSQESGPQFEKGTSKSSVTKMFLDMFGGERLFEGGTYTLQPNEKSKKEVANKIESVIDDIMTGTKKGAFTAINEDYRPGLIYGRFVHVLPGGDIIDKQKIEDSIDPSLEIPTISVSDPCVDAKNTGTEIEENVDDLGLEIPTISALAGKTLGEELQKLKEDRDILQKAADDARKKVDELKNKVNELREQVKTLDEDASSLLSKKSNSVLDNQANFAQANEMGFEANKLERQIEDLEDEINELNSDADAAQKAADEATKKLGDRAESVLDNLSKTYEDTFKSDPNAPKIEKTLDNLENLNEKLQDELKKCEDNMKMSELQNTISSSLQEQITDYVGDQSWQNFASDLKQSAKPEKKADNGIAFYLGDIQGLFLASENKILIQNSALDLADKANLLKAKKETIGNAAFDKIQLKNAEKIDKRSLDNFKTIKNQIDEGLVKSLDQGIYYGEQPKSAIPQSKYYSLVVSGDATRKSDHKSDRVSGTILLYTTYDDEKNLKFNVKGGELTIYDIQNAKVDENLDVVFGKARILDSGKLQLVVNGVGLDAKQNTMSLITDFDGVPRELGDSIEMPNVQGQISGMWDLDAGAVLAPDLPISDSELSDVRGAVILDTALFDIGNQFEIDDGTNGKQKTTPEDDHYDVDKQVEQTPDYLNETKTTTITTTKEETAPAKVFGYVMIWDTNPATPVAGLTVTLRDGAGERTTQTGEDGKYTFENVVPGKVLVSISVPAGKYAPSGGFHAFNADPGGRYMKSFNLFEKGDQ